MLALIEIWNTSCVQEHHNASLTFQRSMQSIISSGRIFEEVFIPGRYLRVRYTFILLQNRRVGKSLDFSSFLSRKKKVHKWKTSRGSHCTFVCACSVFKPFQRLPESFVHHTYALYSPISIKTRIRTHNIQTNTFVPVDSTRRDFIREKIINKQLQNVYMNLAMLQ